MESRPDKTIIALYAAVITALLLQFAIMSVAAQLAGAVLFISVLLACWILPRGQALESLRRTHAQFINRTIWIGGAMLSVSLPLAGIAISAVADPAAIETLKAQFMETYRISQEDLRAALHAYIMDNFALMLGAALLALGPPFAYFTYRLIKGIGLAAAGRPVPSPRAWL